MKKVVYILVILIYAAVAFFGFAGNAYIEVGAGEKMLKSHGVWISVVTIIIGGALSYYYPMTFPKSYSIQKKSGKVMIPIFLILFSFFFTLGTFHYYNSHFGKRISFIIDGFIVSSEKKNGSRHSSRYYLNIRDFASGTLYEFKVKRNVYEQSLLSGSTIKKDFYKGSLGIIYRNSY